MADLTSSSVVCAQFLIFGCIHEFAVVAVMTSLSISAALEVSVPPFFVLDLLVMSVTT
jgi:hypothetical protein